MAYNNAIPQATDLISNSQAQILANFAAIGAATSNLNYLIFPAPQGSDPVPTSTQGVIYTKTASSSSKTELFFDSLNSVPANVIQQLTGNLVTGTDNLGNTDYTVTTPWGLVLKWGGDTFASTGTAMTFSTAFPTALFGVVMTCRHNGAISSSYVSPSPAGFTGSCQSGTGSQFISWFAWGN